MKFVKNSLILIVMLSVLSISCGTPNQSNHKKIDAEELKELIKQDVLLVDVRTPEEFRSGRISGATMIDYNGANFADAVSKLDRDTPVAVYCAVGGRSTRAADLMQEMGFKTVYNYTGGFKDWEKRGEVIEKD
jgi:rhodanese-related sulfurtransferase